MRNNQKIPEGWSVKKLGDIGKVSMCKRIMKNETHPDFGIPFYKISTFGGKPDAYISEELYFKYRNKYSYPKKGDILISAAGTIGKTVVFDGKDAYFQDSNIVWLTHDETKVLNKYLLYCYTTNPWYTTTGGTISRLYNENITKTKLLLPPLGEQKKIALVLETWDEAIEKLSELIEQKKLFKKGLMQRLLTGKIRLPGFTQPWKEVKLGEILFPISKRNKDLKIKRVLSVTNSKGFILPEEQFTRNVASEDLSNYKIVKKGEFAYNPSRLNVGSIDRLDDFEDGVLSPMYVIFVCGNKINSEYMKHWINTKEFNIKVLNSAQGSVRETVDFNTLATIKIYLPTDIIEQQAIANILSAADDEINLLNQKLESFKTQKKGLMQQLLTGKIRVKVN